MLREWLIEENTLKPALWVHMGTGITVVTQRESSAVAQNRPGRSGVKARRPLLLRVLVLWLLGLAVISSWRGLTLWQQRTLLAELGSKLSPPALVVLVSLSALCGVGLIASAVGLWLRHRLAAVGARAVIVVYYAIVQAYSWLFLQSGLLWERRWVSLGLALGAIGLTYGALSWPRSRQWLGL